MHKKIITVICLAGCLCVTCLVGCDEDGQSGAAPVVDTAEIANTENTITIEVDKSGLEPKTEAEPIFDPNTADAGDSNTLFTDEDQDIELPDTGESDAEDTDSEDSDTSDADPGAEAAAAVPGSVESVSLNPSWKYADFTKINSGTAKLYRAADNRKNVVIGVNAGHGTKGGQSVKTYCHPDMTPKVTGGTTAAGSIQAVAVSGGMSFSDGTREAAVTLKMARILRDKLLAKGYDVLMLRDDDDVQLDNVARTVIANNMSNCLISLHWDGDGLDYDKGCFYISTPDGIKNMEPVASHWKEHQNLGEALIKGLKENGCKISGKGSMAIDLTQTSYSTIPSIDVELGNQSSKHDDATLSKLGDGMVAGIEMLY